MIDPPRLFDVGTDPFQKSLLGSAQQDRGSSAAQSRCIAAVGTGVLVATQATASAAATASMASGVTLSTAIAAKGILLGLALGLGVQGAVLVTERITKPTHTKSVGHVKSAPISEHAPQLYAKVPPSVTASLPPPTETLGAIGTSPAVARQASVTSTQRETTVVSSLGETLPNDALKREVALLEEARQASIQGQFAEALTLLDRHRQQFSNGTLGPEALVIRVRALLGQGRSEEATLLAQRFIEANPRSSATMRLQALLGPARNTEE